MWVAGKQTAHCLVGIPSLQWRIHSGVVGVARPLGNHGNNLEAPMCDLLELGSSGSDSHAKCSTKSLNEDSAAGRGRRSACARFFFFKTDGQNGVVLAQEIFLNDLAKTASFWARPNKKKIKEIPSVSPPVPAFLPEPYTIKSPNFFCFLLLQP